MAWLVMIGIPVIARYDVLLYVFPCLAVRTDILVDCFRGLLFKLPATVNPLKGGIANNMKICRHQGVLIFC